MKVVVPHATLPRDNPRLAAVQAAIEAIKALRTDNTDDWADITLCTGGEDPRLLYIIVNVQASTENAARQPLDLIFTAARGDGTHILMRRAPAVEMHKDFQSDRVIYRGRTRFIVGYTDGDIEHVKMPGYGVGLETVMAKKIMSRYLIRMRREQVGLCHDGTFDPTVFYVAEYSDGSEVGPLSLDQIGGLIGGGEKREMPLDANIVRDGFE